MVNYNSRRGNPLNKLEMFSIFFLLPCKTKLAAGLQILSRNLHLYVRGNKRFFLKPKAALCLLTLPKAYKIS